MVVTSVRVEEAATTVRNYSPFELRDGVAISNFDLSVDNFLATMEKIMELCDETKEENFEASEIDQFKSSIVFLREWKQYYFCEWMPFHCKPKTINFACQIDFAEAEHAINGINLPQLSSAAVPKFIANSFCACLVHKYLAVAAHPSGSEYHKIGEPLSGRGVVQIWLFPHLGDKKELSTLNPVVVLPKSRLRKNVDDESFVPTCSGMPNQSVQANQMEVILTSDTAIKDPSALSTSNSLACIPKRRGRPKKSATSYPRDVTLKSNAEIIVDLTVKSNLKGLDSSLNRRGGPKKSALSIPKGVILASNTEYQPDPSVPSTSSSIVSMPKRRGRPRKYPFSIPEESIIAINADHKEDPPNLSTLRSHPGVREHSGRPRKSALLNTEVFLTNGCKHMEDTSRVSTSTELASVKKRRGRPRKSAVSSTNEVTLAIKNEDEGSPKKPILSEESGSVGCIDMLPASSTGSFLLSAGCCIEETLDLNKQEKPAHQESSHLSIDDLDTSLACLSSNCRVNSVTSVLGQRQDEISDPSDTIILSRGCETLGENSITEEAIVVASEKGYSDGTYVMRTCLQRSKMEDKDGATSAFIANEQTIKTSSGFTNELRNGLSGVKVSISKLDSDLPPVSGVHDLETAVLTRHCEGCQEIAAVSKKLDQHKSSILEEFALPRLLLCLAHNGKVAWDVKWRPYETDDSKDKHHMGYLAVLLGDGSLEVYVSQWEVPAHRMVKRLYASRQAVGADPRFLKLEPVFKCSRLKFGDKQSIPLALEWSPSASRNLILAGCHDGTVAIWKFSPHSSSPDTRPLLCFTADNGPIRALAWAPDERLFESFFSFFSDPYRPLWDLCPVQRAVLGLDWLEDPRCIIIAYEDGALRTISLARVANDVPVTGEILSTTKQQGVSSQFCSSFAIWSVQVSRSTDYEPVILLSSGEHAIGLVAYCASDGCTRYFQLTTNAVDKGGSRYREPHFLCSSLSEVGSILTINTPLTSTSLPQKALPSRKVVCEAKQASSSIPVLCRHDDRAIANSSNHKRRKANPSKGPESMNTEIGEGDSSQKISAFPSKTLALHKVRWNMNKGSERWLCYGGAAGIVRCHKVSSRR
ncbi:hypothetical protein AXF42_Ash013589 [Apostasia shenzhenica]|uniref:Uncharacterized protein n=1 Tax=Apostasia shenzhenica TaxID=1088818 RepID=A0A2I0APB8_9ASPA|nr:hypothetical protein AXF42_Ash013589 [Apostasia shenzhenica]